MTIWEEKLLGELVGLARATEGNEHLITESITHIIAEILLANVCTETKYVHYISKIHIAKRKMVPDCFQCANPCGKTAALDLSSLLEKESPQIWQIKYAIANELRTLAASERSQHAELKLYRGLIILGLEGYTADELSALFAGL